MASWRQYTVLLMFVSLGVGTMAGDAVAQSDPMYNEGTNDIFDMLDRLKEFLLDVLLRVGMVVMIFGALLWFSARESAERAGYGKWLIKGGAGMMILSLAFTAVTALIEWIAIGQ